MTACYAPATYRGNRGNRTVDCPLSQHKSTGVWYKRIRGRRVDFTKDRDASVALWYEELARYVDVPAFSVGDLHYIDNLVAALEASDASAPQLHPPQKTEEAPGERWPALITGSPRLSDAPRKPIDHRNGWAPARCPGRPAPAAGRVSPEKREPRSSARG